MLLLFCCCCFVVSVVTVVVSVVVVAVGVVGVRVVVAVLLLFFMSGWSTAGCLTVVCRSCCSTQGCFYFVSATVVVDKLVITVVLQWL